MLERLLLLRALRLHLLELLLKLRNLLVLLARGGLLAVAGGVLDLRLLLFEFGVQL